MNIYLESKQGEITKALEFFEKDIATLRVGRASASLLSGITVELYGVRTPIQGLANIKQEDARTLLVEPWDKGSVKDIEKEIVDANLGVSVSDEGSKIRLKIPEMTEEKRKEVVKRLNQKHESARVSLRQIRDDIKKDIEKAENNKEISEDDKFDFTFELDEFIGDKNKELKGLCEKKEVDIMNI